MSMLKNALLAVSVMILLAALVAHLRSAIMQEHIVTLATTTSVYDSGLLDAVIPVFEGSFGIGVKVIPAGSGQALEIAKRGDVDLVLVHSRDLEVKFIKDGYGVHRIGLMYNDFLIVGPCEDPAEICGLKDAAEALLRIAVSGSKFVSRADMSGTHLLELGLWRSINIAPPSGFGSWYIEANRGMGSVLRIADEVGAYTIVDRATWLSFKDQVKRLTALVEGDPLLLNPYSLILVNPERNPHVNHKGAVTLARFLVSEDGQRLIENFKKNGEVLFKPLAQDFESARRMGYCNQSDEFAWYLMQETYEEKADSRVAQRTFLDEVLNITVLSLQVSLSAVLIGSIIGIPVGAYLGLKRFHRKRMLVSLVEVTLKTSVNTLMGLPPVVAGLIVYLVFNRFGPLGTLSILYTPAAMIIVQLILVTPIIVGVTMSTVANVEEAIRERALSLGATERQAAWTVIRESRGGILTAIIVAFGAAISEVGGIMIAGGNIRWFTRTLTTAIVTETELGNFESALTLGIILLGISFMINLALTIIQVREAKVRT